MNFYRSSRSDGGITSLLLSPKEVIILELLLAKGGELFGLEMVEASGGSLKRGTIYVTLHRMKEKGFVDSKLEPRCPPQIGIPRRIYSATGLGERALKAHSALSTLWQAHLAESEV
jgi:DNA-binding PadR family transcriptional regulator